MKSKKMVRRGNAGPKKKDTPTREDRHAQTHHPLAKERRRYVTLQQKKDHADAY